MGFRSIRRKSGVLVKNRETGSTKSGELTGMVIC